MNDLNTNRKIVKSISNLNDVNPSDIINELKDMRLISLNASIISKSQDKEVVKKFISDLHDLSSTIKIETGEIDDDFIRNKITVIFS